jgi:hypothetical protein
MVHVPGATASKELIERNMDRINAELLADIPSPEKDCISS